MRVIAYNVSDREKELLILANSKIHDFTFISNPLSLETIHYVKGKEVVIVSDRDKLDNTIIRTLHELGVRSIITRSISTDHVDLNYAGKLRMHVANTPFKDQSEKGIAKQAIDNLNNWMKGDCVGTACQCKMDCTNNSLKKNYHHE